MIVAVPAETGAGENRVALVPAVVPALAKAGLEVTVEKGAGLAAGFPDAEYEARGARIVEGRAALLSRAAIVLRVRGAGPGGSPSDEDVAGMKPGQILVGLLNPLGDPEGARRLAARKVTAYALELLPRTSRAQPMDVLTSMATISGYRAALMAAAGLPKLYPMMVTPAGTITPAHVFVLGAGVAGLQAIATSRRLGAVVTAYDIRPEVREQVESVGGRFLDLGLKTADASVKNGYARAMDEEFYRRQQEMMSHTVGESDAVITTAAVPGKKAPILVTEAMVRKMRPGSIIVDLAAEGGGNCEMTRAGETVEAWGVRIMGPVNLPSSVATHASQMFAKNVAAFLTHAIKDGAFREDPEDSILNDTLLTRDGEIASAPVRSRLGMNSETVAAV
ncbi:MAG TPA: NAD(P) transhydrogenase subunit alpha [Candidatus Saccharimonadales bacterium]|nr:NAD(P) transhydrogenase subunit alpha [Candidatus Saccharimonadales bacterium]